ncbi:MAG TPA: hypothetical protein DCF68_09150 [Cyanothece sp. UBA12306]|nr:hypothetical protein [Cyanothece sp. UBA12306]
MNQSQVLFKSSPVTLCLLGLGLVSVSFASIFIAFGEQQLSSNSIVFNRLWITSIIYLIWLGFQQISQVFSSRNWLKQKLQDNSSLTESKQQNLLTQNSTWSLKNFALIIVLGFCFCANQIIWSWSLEHTSIANSTILHNLTPIFTIVGARLFLKQQFDNQFTWGALLSVVGAIAIEVEDLSFAFDRFQGDLAALVSAVLYSGYLLVINELRNDLGIVNIILGCCLMGTFMVFPLLIIEKDILFPQTIHAWLSVIGLVLVCQVLGQALIAYCLRAISVGIVSLSHLLCPCMSAVEAWFIFGEDLNTSNLLGFVTILLGLYVAVSGSTTRK